MKILLTLSYDGSGYCGWQVQPATRTVQGTLEACLTALYKHPVTVLGAGRTDALVHATGQRACFTVPETAAVIPVKNLPSALNSALPGDITVTAAKPVAPDFCPMRCAIGKTYEYAILNQKHPNPKLRHYARHISQPLNFEAMSQACRAFEGTHDFAAFCSTGSSATTTTRTIRQCSVSKNGAFIYFTVTGNGFLYKMVRTMAGTLIDIGLGKKPATAIPQIIESRNRTMAGKTAPACGLTLVSVEY